MKRTLILALVCATTVKLYFALSTQGSLDVRGFQDHLVKINELGVGAYRVRGAFDNPFNHPPAMIHVLRFMGWLASTSGLPFRFWLRLPSILADVGTFLLVAHWVTNLWPDRRHFAVLMALAICPVAIMISGYHGNTDSVMVFLLLLSLYLVERDSSPWLAGVVFGLSVCVKVVPLAFAPAICLYLTSWRRRFAFFGAAAITFVLCSLPYLAQEPRAILSTVFGYTSIYGHWGWTQLAVLVFPDLPKYLHKPYDVQGSHAVFALILKLMTVALICAASIWINLRRRKPSLLIQGGLIMAIVLFMAAGFGSQYLIWLVPFVAALGLRTAALYYTTSTIYLAPMYACIAFVTCIPPLLTVLFAFVCWLSVFIIIRTYLRELASSPK